MTAAAIIGAWLTVAAVFTGWLCQAARSSTPAADEWVLWEHEQAMRGRQPARLRRRQGERHMSFVSREEPRFCDLCDISLDLHPNPADVQHPEDCAVADRMLGLR